MKPIASMYLNRRHIVVAKLLTEEDTIYNGRDVAGPLHHLKLRNGEKFVQRRKVQVTVQNSNTI